jgi:hypothetical protein
MSWSFEEILAMAAEPDDGLPTVQGEGVRVRPFPGTERPQPGGAAAIAGRDETLGLNYTAGGSVLVRLGHAAILAPAFRPAIRQPEVPAV